MARSLNDILFRFLGDTKSLDKATKRGSGGLKSMEKSAGLVSSAMSGIGKVAGALGIGVAAKQLLDFGADSLRMASDFDESVNAVEVATGIAAQSILKIGESAAESFGLTKTELNEAAVVFAGFGKQLDGGIGANFEDYIQRATDFASVMNIEVADSIRIFSSTLAGESEPIRRYGKTINAAAIKAYALAEGIIDVGDTMTDQEKIQARYGLLMEETSEVQGDFAETSGEVANAQRIATAEMGNARIELGERLIPVQEKWIKVQGQAVKALSGLVTAMNDADKESELSARLMFEWAKETGKVTGSYEDLVAAGDEAASSGSGWGRVWDFLVGRTADLDEKLDDVRGTTQELTDTQVQAKRQYEAYAKGMNDIGLGLDGIRRNALGIPFALDPATSALEDAAAAADAAAKNLAFLNDMVDIFSGNIFGKAARLKEAAAELAAVEALFAGGGGSGEVADPVSASHALNDFIEVGKITGS